MENFLTLIEVARCLGLSIPDTEKALRKSGLRSSFASGQRRYLRDDVVEWLEAEFGSLTAERLRNMDLSNASTAGLDPSQPFVTRILEAGNIHAAVPARTRSSMLRSLAALACESGATYDERALLEELEERESVVSTALPVGVAFPHPRDMRRIYVENDLLLLARTLSPIPFGAQGGRLTSLFFLLLFPDPSMHLHVLARLNRLLRDDRLIGGLLAAEDEQEMLFLVKCVEEALISSAGSAAGS